MTEYQKLKNICSQIDTLINARVDSYNPEFIAWKSKTERFLTNKYGMNSIEVSNFRNIQFNFRVCGINTSKSEYIEKCCDGLKTAQIILNDLLEELGSDKNSAAMLADALVESSHRFSKVFIVHGHDGELKEAVARLLEKQDIDPVILGEKANQGKTIIEKIENYSDVGAAIMLFTPDDFGRAKDSELEQYRARQNVVFEAGYFMAKLGRDHTIMLAAPNVEIPSDLQGVVYTDTALWKFGVLQELQAMGYSVDLNKVLS